MSDSDEADDGMILALEAAERLQKLKPDHELLKYFDLTDDARFREFAERFGKPGIPLEDCRGYHWNAYALAKYFLALEAACEDPLKPIVVTHGGNIPSVQQASVLKDVTTDDDDLPW